MGKALYQSWQQNDLLVMGGSNCHTCRHQRWVKTKKCMGRMRFEDLQSLNASRACCGAEFGERVQRLGKMVSPLKLAGRLLDTIRVGQIPAAGLVATAGGFWPHLRISCCTLNEELGPRHSILNNLCRIFWRLQQFLKGILGRKTYLYESRNLVMLLKIKKDESF